MKRIRSRLKTPGQSPTVDRSLPGALAEDDRDALLEDLTQSFGSTTATRLWQVYGGLSRELADSVHENSELGQRLGPQCDLFVGELVRAIEQEHAQTLVDVLHRRTMAGLQSDFGRRSAPLAADWLVRLGIWDKTRAAQEVEAHRRFAHRHAVPLSRERPTDPR